MHKDAPDGYEAVMQVVRERPGLISYGDVAPEFAVSWLDVIVACYKASQMSDEFAGAWVRRHSHGWFPGLMPLVRHGVLAKVRPRPYYRLVDPEGVSRALLELNRI